VEHGVEQGSLLILDRQGHLVSILQNHQFLDGPWDLTIHDSGTTAQVFVSNVLSATVTRLDLKINPGGQLALVQATQIASGYAHRCDPAALVVGPTGLALDPKSGTLYVASTGDNEIFAVSNAMTATSDLGTGAVFIHDDLHLHGPLALALAPNGDLITAQGDAVNPDSTQPSEIVEFTSDGRTFQRPIDTAPGSAFGLALGSSGGSLRFAAVDDNLNVLDIWIVSTEQSFPGVSGR
jgi:DNA-binding beta-propeller fold protein YncE